MNTHFSLAKLCVCGQKRLSLKKKKRRENPNFHKKIVSEIATSSQATHYDKKKELTDRKTNIKVKRKKQNR